MVGLRPASARTNSHFDHICFPLRDDDERRYDLGRRRDDCVQDVLYERGQNVTGTQVDDAGVRFSPRERQRPEIPIMGEDHATVRVRVPEDLDVGPAAQTLSENRGDVVTSSNEALDHVWVNIFVGEQRVIERPHAESFTSQTTSFLKALAAYWSAAVRPSSST